MLPDAWLKSRWMELPAGELMKIEANGCRFNQGGSLFSCRDGDRQ
jgi:hypothetical protein